MDQVEDLEAVELGHLDVEEEQVGGEVGDGLDSLEAVGAFGGDLDFGVTGNEFAKKGPGQLLVVDNHRAQHHPQCTNRTPRHVTCNVRQWMSVRFTVLAMAAAGLCM